MLQNQFFEHRGVHRLFKNDRLQTFETAALDDVIFIVVESRHENDGQARAILPNRLVKLIAVHVGHDDIAQHEVEFLLLEIAERMDAGGRGLNAAMLLFQEVLKRLADTGIVIDDQDSDAP